MNVTDVFDPMFVSHFTLCRKISLFGQQLYLCARRDILFNSILASSLNIFAVFSFLFSLYIPFKPSIYCASLQALNKIEYLQTCTRSAITDDIAAMCLTQMRAEYSSILHEHEVDDVKWMHMQHCHNGKEATAYEIRGL